jgi:glutaminyl-tRNA synthetase
MEGTFLSKRKIAKLVESGLVSGWDDPRLYTLIALRRRGVPPGAILSFVNNLGVTTTTSQIALHRYEHAVRSYLEMKTPRLMLVLKPLKVTLTNVPDDFEEKIEKPLHSKDASMGSNTIYLTKNLYIDADDFREEDSKDFFRLAPGKTVGLLYASRPITCTDFKKDPSTGEITEVLARYEGYEEGKAPAKVKTYIHWVAEHAASQSPVRVEEARFFKQLFKSSDPASLKDYIADIDPNSLQITKGALLEVGIWDLVKQVTAAEKTGEEKKEQEKLTTDPSAALAGGTAGGNERVRFQGLRTAYFCLDKEAVVKGLNSASGDDKVILNCIVSLKEDKTK